MDSRWVRDWIPALPLFERLLNDDGKNCGSPGLRDLEKDDRDDVDCQHTPVLVIRLAVASCHRSSVGRRFEEEESVCLGVKVMSGVCFVSSLFFLTYTIA